MAEFKVIDSKPLKAGFSGKAMLDAAVRGRAFGPNTVIGAEFQLLAPNAADFRDVRTVRDLLLRELVKTPWGVACVGMMVRACGAPIAYTHPIHGAGFAQRYEVMP